MSATVPALTLYNAPGSTCSQRVRFVLAVKDLPFEEHKLNLLTGDQLKPEYLRLNPNGVVPTLVHDGRAVIDSSVIIEYLDEVFPEPVRLSPEDPLQRAEMRSLMRFIDEVPAAAIRVPSFNMAFVRVYHDMPQAEFDAMAGAKPLRKEFMQEMGRTGFPQAEMDKALDRLGRTMARLDDSIAAHGGPWLMGERLTLADIMVMPTLVRMADIGLADIWDDRPRIAAWLEAIRTQPAYGKTYYPGSHVSERFKDLAPRRPA